MTTEIDKTKTARTAAGKTTGKPRPQALTSKKDQLVRMLGRKGGADIATISEKLGWLPHTTRAALTGLRKDGYEIASERIAGAPASRYRIIAAPKPAAV